MCCFLLHYLTVFGEYTHLRVRFSQAPDHGGRKWPFFCTTIQHRDCDRQRIGQYVLRASYSVEGGALSDMRCSTRRYGGLRWVCNICMYAVRLQNDM